MTTIVNNPGPRTSNEGGVGLLVGVILLILFVFLLLYLGLPGIRGGGSLIPTFNVPERIDVNINQGNQGQ